MQAWKRIAIVFMLAIAAPLACWYVFLFLPHAATMTAPSVRNLPVAVAASLTLADRQEIATAVAHDLFTLADSATIQVTLTLDIEGSDAALVERHVAQTYPAGQRFIDGVDRIEKNQCWFDKHSGLPSLGIGIGAIHLSDAGTAEVTGGSAMCMMGTQQSTYILRRVNGHWRVAGIARDVVI